MVPYSKPYKTASDLVALLQTRGLKILLAYRAFRQTLNASYSNENIVRKVRQLEAVLQAAESGVCIGVKALRKSIGMSGLMVLRAVINEKTVDEWVMEELL